MTLADEYATRIKRLHAAIKIFLKELYAVGPLDKPKLGKSPAKAAETFKQFALRTIPPIIETADAAAQRVQKLPALLHAAAAEKKLPAAERATVDKLARKSQERLLTHLITITKMFTAILEECTHSSRAPTTLLQTVRTLIDQDKEIAETALQGRTEYLVDDLAKAEDLIAA